jgi:type IX secretion system PorP/SprF family membrane protein
MYQKTNLCISIKIWYSTIFLLALAFSRLSAQDIHFSQYYNSPLNLNPAFTGMIAEDIRYSGIYRSQWFSVGNSFLDTYQTTSLAYDKKLNTRAIKAGVLGIGGVLDYDRSGDSRMTNAKLGLSASLTKRIGEYTLLSAGLQMGLLQRNYSSRNLTFDAQYNGALGIFDGGIPTGENFRDYNIWAFDLGAGVNLRYQLKDKRSKLDFGVGFFHPHKPLFTFEPTSSIILPIRFTVHSLISIKASKRVDGVVQLAGQSQGSYNEFMAGGGVRYYLSLKKYDTKSIFFGAHYRFAEREDAVYPTVELWTEQWHAGVSYDITLSKLFQANVRRGGPEVSFTYLITKVKNLKSSKNCPIF